MQHTRLYVGDLPSTAGEQDLTDLFGQVGQVVEVSLFPNARYGFVEMGAAHEAQSAVRKFDGYSLGGSKLLVHTVPPRSFPRSSGGGFFS